MKLSIDFGESLHIFAGISETFPSLKELSIINQKIKYIDETDFEELKYLEKLYLKGNQIEYLSKYVVWNLNDLKVLDLSDNKIKEIPEDFFSFSLKLEILMLQNNKISHLPARLFYQTSQLKEFHAWGNPLRTIDLDFGNLPNVKFYKNSSSDYFKANIEYLSRIHFVQ